MKRSRGFLAAAATAAMSCSTVLADASTGFLFAARCNEIACDIVRWQVDGTSVFEVFAGGPESGASGLAVDPVHGKVYFGRRTSLPDPPFTAGSIERCDYDGSDVELLVPGLDGVGSLAVDPFGGKVYFVAGSFFEPEILRANLDGSAIETIVPDASNAADLDVDPIAGKLYWTFSTVPSSTLFRANLDGSSPTTVLTFPGELLTGIAADPGIGLFATLGESGRIVKILPGPNVHEVLTQADFPGFQPGGIVLDRGKDLLYFTGAGGPTSSGVWRVATDGSGLEQLAEGTPASGFGAPDLAVPGNTVLPASSPWSLLVLIAGLGLVAAWTLRRRKVCAR
jgi:hypothetical protein